jgi:hypothetical protein
MAGVISYWCVVDARVQSHTFHMGFVVIKVAPEQLLLQVLEVSLVPVYQYFVLIHLPPMLYIILAVVGAVK